MPARPRSAPFRLLAIFLAAVVLALGLLAWSPDAHARLHTASASESCHADHLPDAGDDTDCVITLFAQGLPLAAPPPHPLPPRALAQVAPLAAPEASPPLAPARLHPPAQGPPRAHAA